MVQNSEQRSSYCTGQKGKTILPVENLLLQLVEIESISILSKEEANNYGVVGADLALTGNLG